MKFNTIIKLLEKNDIDHKLVNDSIIVYPDGYATNTTSIYIELGDGVYNKETKYYDEFEFSDNFDEFPENLEEWLTHFAETSEHIGYDR
jgi:hypothetical protein